MKDDAAAAQNAPAQTPRHWSGNRRSPGQRLVSWYERLITGAEIRLKTAGDGVGDRDDQASVPTMTERVSW